MSISLNRTSNNEGPVLVLQGDTYPIKEELKALGCRWSTALKAWFLVDTPENQTKLLEWATAQNIKLQAKDAKARDLLQATASKHPLKGDTHEVIWTYGSNGGVVFTGSEEQCRGYIKDTNDPEEYFLQKISPPPSQPTTTEPRPATSSEPPTTPTFTPNPETTFTLSLLLREDKKGNWVARIVDTDPTYTFKRSFVKSQTAREGGRMRYTWVLPDGLYEVSTFHSAKNHDRYFMQIQNGTPQNVSQAEIEAMLTPMLAAAKAELVFEMGLSEEAALQKAKETGKRIAFKSQLIDTDDAIGRKAAEKIESDLTTTYTIAQPDGKIVHHHDHHY